MAVKMSPPDQWADDNGPNLKFVLTALKSFYVIMSLPNKAFETFLETAQVRWPGD